MDIRAELSSAFPNELVDALVDAYSEIEQAFALGKWKASELDSGHFVEAARRILEYVLFGKYTAIGKPLPGFSDHELKKYEQGSGDESYRILIPRILKSIYNLRNKRGVGHLGNVSPNEMDATYILYSVKWVLAELLRLSSGQDAGVVQSQISGIVERKIGTLWKYEDVVRILNPSCSARDQVLVFLFDESPRSASELQALVEYKNTTNFRKILARLHTSRLIELQPDGRCIISPTGQLEAENIISRLSSANRA
ncbi:hypothetical protein [Wenzhouxiangella sp. EGI_FJ10409]|uniref:hypothetical protein n=1 Tax=Wenzhouxiangella sp. EGI_FJ10409 TaxID=3243767 RepID=UPI0035DAD6A8